MPAKKATSLPKNHGLYTKLMACIPGIEIKGATMPYTSMNGNMFSFLKEGAVGLRLPEKEREEFIKKYATSLFETYGTVMKEYVSISEKLLIKTKVLTPYVIASHDYAKTLKAKPVKKADRARKSR